MNRRELLGLLCTPALWAQYGGMASRTVKPLPRGKPSGLPFHARFTDIAREAGLREPVIYGGVDRKAYILETVGCGAAFIDYDNDGWLDIFLPSGTRFEGAEGATNRLYRNNRDGTFTDVTEKAGLHRAGWAAGVAVGDYNNDGFDDLFLTGWGQNTLYRNNGNGTFTDVTAHAGLLHEKARWGSGCTFIDYDRNGLLDLFVGTYLEFDPKAIPPAGDGNCNWKGIPVHCGPRGLPPGTASLYRNNGDGTFTDVTETSGVGKAKGSYMLTAVAADFDNDGWPDIYVACDSTPSLLFHNNRDGTFREVGLLRGVALNQDGNPQAGMGLGVGDYNLDGSLDIFRTHFSDDVPALLRYRQDGNFEDVAIPSGLGVETRFVGWGAGIVDLDNDGLPDLFMAAGGVFPEVARKLPNYPLNMQRVIFRNLGGGRFEEILDSAGPGIEAAHCSRGCAFGDFDNDGDIDILVVNLNEPPSLLRNDLGGNNHWLKIKLVGVQSNRGAVGARVTARYGDRVQAQEVLSQSSFLSASDPRLHFGLGPVEKADLDIRWPNGGRETIPGVAADQFVVIREGAGVVHRENFARRRPA
jgi:enediyne biosynthesis protein E4